MIWLLMINEKQLRLYLTTYQVKNVFQYELVKLHQKQLQKHKLIQRQIGEHSGLGSGE